MSDTPNLNYLREEVRKLQSLLNDPHPGLFAWREMYATQVRKLMDFWTDKPIRESALPTQP